MAEAVPSGSMLETPADELSTLDVPSLPEHELAQLVVSLERLLNAAHCLSAVALDELQRRGTWAEDGSLSAASWARSRTASPVRSLRARVRQGAGLRLLPITAAAVRNGRLSPFHLDVLAGCARRHPELAARDEVILLEQAEALDAEAFAVAIRHWEERATAVDSPDPAALVSAEPADELHLSRPIDGRYQLNGTFSAQTGQLVAAALDGEVDRALRAGRDRDPAVPLVVSQVRAAALVDLIGQTMRREPSEASMPDRYRVAVVVTADHAGDLPLEACDSPAFRCVISARGEVLDVGRLTQQWPPGIRRAITLRDGGCVFPGCDRPPSWCDVHHCTPWSGGGKTAVANGALLCRRHHTFIHTRRWSVGVENGRPQIRKPDGAPHAITRWPPSASTIAS